MIIKLKVTMQINFISSKDSEETRTMNTKSSNIGIIMGNETDEIIKKLFDSLLQKYQDGLEESIRGNEFIRYSVGLLYYYLQKIGFKRGRSYIDSPEWLKNKRATINPKNNDDSCFQYALTVALNHKKDKSHPERISKIKPFIGQYNWKEIYYPSHPKTGKCSNKTIRKLLLISYLYCKILKK